MSKLTKIEHLKDYPKRLLKLVSVASRIEAFLEDMNIDPAALHSEFDLGSIGRRTEIFHASTIGSQGGKSLCGRYPMGCGRELYYGLVGAESEGAWEPRIRRILDTGTAVHSQLQAYLSEIAVRSEGEFSFEPEVDCNPNANEIADMMDLSGHTDGDIRVVAGEDEVRFLLEIKTINDAGYKKTSSPHAEHIMQGTIYQKCLDAPLIVFLYYNKNDSSMAEFIQPFDEHRWQAIEDKLNMVRECAMKDEIPDREVSFQCSRCKYKLVCKPPRRQRARNTRVFRK